MGLRDGLLDLLEEGHCARMVEPLPGLELEGLVQPRTCGCLQVQKEEAHIYLIATFSELPNILNVSLALVKRNYLAVEAPLLLQCPVSHEDAEGTRGQKGLEEIMLQTSGVDVVVGGGVGVGVVGGGGSCGGGVDVGAGGGAVCIYI